MAKVYKVPALIVADASVDDEVTVNAILDSVKRMTFTGEVPGQGAGGVDTAVITAANGKVKKYSDIDSMVRELAKADPNIVTVHVNVPVDRLTPENLSYDLEAVNARALVRAQAALAKQTITVAALVAKLATIASWATGTTAQQAAFVELTRQKDTADAYKTHLTALVDSLDGP